jgi:nucleoside-diphosphate-sugar epimerase
VKRILVTGATGFIGRHTLAPLRNRRYDVHAVTSATRLPAQAGATWHRADLLDPDAMSTLVGTLRPTHLMHFAWSLVPGGAAAPAQNLRWIQATLDLVRQFHLCGGHRAVLAGTCAEYDWSHGRCVEGETPVEPRSFYGACKNAARSLCEAFAAGAGLSLAWGRIFFVYGPHEPLPRLVPSIVSSLSRGEVARCTRGDQRRDYLHVADVADAFVALLGTDVRGPVNVGSGQAVEVREIAMHVARRMGAAHLLQLGALAAPADDVPLVVADVRRLSREAGWAPRYALGEGLDDTVDWWTGHLSRATSLERGA